MNLNEISEREYQKLYFHLIQKANTSLAKVNFPNRGKITQYENDSSQPFNMGWIQHMGFSVNRQNFRYLSRNSGYQLQQKSQIRE